MTDMDDVEELSLDILRRIGYLPRTGDSVEEARKDVAFRLFVDCFLRRRDKAWTPEEMAVVLETTKPTIYRHISKLKNMDLLEAVPVVDEEGRDRKGYRIRYGDLSKAWGLVEAHVDMAMQTYRKNINHLQNLIEKERNQG